MGSDLITGLRISVIGMSITFLALILLILVMILLVRFFPDRSATKEQDSNKDLTTTENVDEQRLEEMAV